MLNQAEHQEYRAIIGALLYLAVYTRPDLSFPVSALARNLHAPTKRHQANLKRLLRYLSGTTSFGLNFKMGRVTPDALTAHVDANWGGCRETRLSTTGFVVAVNGGPILWKSQRQTVIALSSAESEYVAMSSCATQVVWIRRLIWEIAVRKPWESRSTLPPTVVFADSTTAIALATNEQVNTRNKHIDIRVHHVRELIHRKIIRLEYTTSTDNTADLLTKAVRYHVLKALLEKLKLTNEEGKLVEEHAYEERQ